MNKKWNLKRGNNRLYTTKHFNRSNFVTRFVFLAQIIFRLSFLFSHFSTPLRRIIYDNRLRVIQPFTSRVKIKNEQKKEDFSLQFIFPNENINFFHSRSRFSHFVAMLFVTETKLVEKNMPSKEKGHGKLFFHAFFLHLAFPFLRFSDPLFFFYSS